VAVESVKLVAIMYHYVRNTEDSEFPGIHAVREETFVSQIEALLAKYEPASFSTMIDYLHGEYHPRRSLFVVTFDDGLKEHGNFVTEALNNRGVQGQFFIPTACLEEHYVLPVHKNHLLLASLPFQRYREMFMQELRSNYPGSNLEIDDNQVRKTYRWDKMEVARFKFLSNYKLPVHQRDHILKIIFQREIGNEKEFAQKFYLDWSDLNAMYNKGMLIGGHGHMHGVLSNLTNEAMSTEIETCFDLIRNRTQISTISCFSYPFGKRETYNPFAIKLLRKLGVRISYTSIGGLNSVDSDPFQLARIDPKDLDMLLY